ALWTAGKLNCRHCGARLGGFSFLARSDCPCGRDATVHLSKSRVDLDQTPHVLIVQPRRTSSGTGLLMDLCQSEEEASLDSFQLTCLPCLSPIIPPDALDPLCAAENSHGAAGHPDKLELHSSVRSAAEHQSDPDHEAWRNVLPWVSEISGGSQSSLELQQTEEVSLRRFTSEAEAELEEEADPVLSSFSAWIRRNKRDKNRLKSQRRKQRRRERWLQSQMKEAETESSTDSPLDSEDVDRDGLTCAVCVDVFFRPHTCQPCAHVFCEPCLRRLAKNRATNTPCPLCRCLISHTSFHRELDLTAKTLFPKVWATCEQNFQNAPCARWPLPSSQEHSRFFWVNQRRGATAWGRWHFTPGAFVFNMLGLPHHTFFHIDMILFIFALKLLCCLSVLLCKLIF
ncbi:hypothetical protein XENOCAPTIV_025609, partial [Xenoophorus captivus]